ncbi:MAG: hypothetical protein QOH90_609 [Actinomycetota bacterium]|jgi:hypothetical protein|nr:hypothetical protein [Actinomycetota bacterium]
MTKVQSRARQGIAGVAAAGLLALGLATAPVQAAATPPRQIVTVIANVNKAYGGIHEGKSIHDMSSIKAFVTRAVQMTPSAPDVVLLQELRKEGAAAAAKSFTNKTGDKYIVAVGPPRNHPTLDYAAKQIHTETAILLNTASMEKSSGGGFIKSSYTHAEGSGGKIKVKKNAFVLATQKSSGLTVALASVHYTPVGDLKSKAVSDRLRGEWSKQIATTLHNKYPTAGLTNIGGDFNTIRCFSGAFKSCKEAAFWKYLSTHGFVDSLYVLPQPGGGGAESCMTRATGVDFVFSTGNPQAGGIDTHGGYSDHKLRWVKNVAAPYAPC